MMQLLNITCSGPYEVVRYKYESEIKSKTQSFSFPFLFTLIHTLTL